MSTSLYPASSVGTSRSTARPGNMTSSSLADCPTCGGAQSYDHLMDDSPESFWKKRDVDFKPPYSRNETILAGGTVAALLVGAWLVTRTTKKKGKGDTGHLSDGTYSRGLNDGSYSKHLGDGRYSTTLADGRSRKKPRRTSRK